MLNFDVTIHEKCNRNTYFNDIYKIESVNNYIRFFDQDYNVLYVEKSKIEKLEIIYQGN